MNVWVALAAEDHPHHGRTKAYWRTEASRRVAFCRLTMLGFIRVATNSRLMDGQPLTVPEAWATYETLRRVERITVAPEPAGCEELLAAWVAAGAVLPRMWTDAYLAAFATAGGYRLVSFDGDFSRFGGLAWKHLVP